MEEVKYACRACGEECASFECQCGSNKDLWDTESQNRKAKYLRLIKSEQEVK